LSLDAGHLDGVGPPEFGVLQDASLKDLDGGSLSPVPTLHLLDHLSDLTVDGEVPVFLVHVVGIGPGVIPEPDAVVGDLGGVLLEEFDLPEDFTTGLLLLVDPLHEVPELGPLEDLVLGEDFHLVDLRDGDLLSGLLPTADFVVVLAHVGAGVLFDLTDDFLDHFGFGGFYLVKLVEKSSLV